MPNELVKKEKKDTTTFKIESNLPLPPQNGWDMDEKWYGTIYKYAFDCALHPPVQPPNMHQQPQTFLEWDTDELPHNCHHTSHSCYTALPFDGLGGLASYSVHMTATWNRFGISLKRF